MLALRVPRRAWPRPTRFGWAFLLLFTLTLSGCINYGLSVGYGLSFLLLGVWFMAAGQASRAAWAVQVTLSAPLDVTAGQPVEYALLLNNQGGEALVRVALHAQNGQSAEATVRVPGGQTLSQHLYLPVRQRGPLALQAVQVSALDRLGLWQSPFPEPAFPPPVLVFPAPEPAAPPAPSRTVAGSGDGVQRTKGDEEFAGLRPYTPGDSPRQVSWRHVARTGMLLTRETDAPQGRGLLLDWADTAPAGDTEARLSRLATWVEQVRRSGQPFALTLPGQILEVGQGAAHVRTALMALAQQHPLPAPQAAPVEPPVRADSQALRVSLLALAFTLLLSLPHQPAWLSALMMGLLLHSAWRTFQTRPAIPTWLLGVLAGISAVLLNQHYGLLLGRDAGTAFLGLLVALKTAEIRTRRDGHLLVLLGLFLSSTPLLRDQTPLITLHTLLSTVGWLSAAPYWVTTTSAPASRKELGLALRRAAQLTTLAFPLAVTLFLLFPRPSRPLWVLPLQTQASTGLASEINAGEYSQLAQNTAVAFRVDFAGSLPPPEQRYWRGPVYEAFDGQTWRQVRIAAQSPSLEPRGPGWTYTMTLEPSGLPWLLALDVPTQLPERTFLTSAFQAVITRPSSNRRRFTLHSRPARLGVQESRNRLEFNLRLPPGQNPRAVELARPWRTLAPAQRVQAGLDYLRRGDFSYTLTPPTLPEQDRVDAFLFQSRQGFCEHYAQVFTVLMRAAGLPARIVGGYMGGQLNPDGGYLIVRQQDAHAWTEVWLPGQGWLRVDPTAVIAPARVNAGLSTALTSPQARSAAPLSSWGRVRLRLDALQNRWNDLVIGYDGQQQQALLARSGLGQVGSPLYWLMLALLFSLAWWPAQLWLKRQGVPLDPAQRALLELTRKLGLPREPGETLTAYLSRARQRYPHLGPALDDLQRAYQQARYAPEGQHEALRALQQMVKKVKA